jgi:hypothetical protein
MVRDPMPERLRLSSLLVFRLALLFWGVVKIFGAGLLVAPVVIRRLPPFMLLRQFMIR